MKIRDHLITSLSILGLLASGSWWLIRAQTPHPCDTTPTSVQAVTAGQSFTFGWCHNLKDTNGVPTSIVEYRVYRNNAPFAVVPGSAQSAPNAAGFVYASIMQTELVAGQVTWEVSAVNVTGEGMRGGPLSVSVSVVPSVPAAPSRSRLTVP